MNICGVNTVHDSLIKFFVFVGFLFHDLGLQKQREDGVWHEFKKYMGLYYLVIITSCQWERISHSYL